MEICRKQCVNTGSSAGGRCQRNTRRREKIKMKDFWEDLGKKIGETAETMTNRAGDAIEIQRLKGQVRTLARGNAVDLMALGKMIYDRFKEGEEVEEAAKGLCEAIRTREENMNAYEKKIARIKGACECSNCGKMVAKDMLFCPYCGEKVNTSVFDDAEEEGTDEAADIFADEAEEDAYGEKLKEAAEECADAVKEKAADVLDKAAEKMGEAADKMEETADKMKSETAGEDKTE